MNDIVASRHDFRFGHTFLADLDTAESFSGADAYWTWDTSFQAPTNTFDMVVYDAPYLGGNITGIRYFKHPPWEFFVPTSGEQFETAEEAQAQGNADMLVNIEALKFTNGTLFFSDDGTALAVKSLYESFLGRTADAEGFFFWFKGLKSDLVNIEQVTDAFVAARAANTGDSIEANPGFVEELYLEHHLIRNDDTALAVKSLYENFLGRTPDAEGFSFWFNNLWSEEANLERVADAFVAARATSLGDPNQSNQEFVEDLYNGFFDGHDDTGLRYWTTNLDSNLLDRGDVLTAFVEISVNVTGQSHRVFVDTTEGLA